MVDDNMFESRKGNFTAKGLEGTEPITGRFSRETERGRQIAEASPEAQRMIRDQVQIEERQMEKEQKSQARSHEFRVLRERDRQFEKFFNSNEPMPSDPAAKQVVYQTICDQADRRVQEREAYYRDQIPHATDRKINEILEMDRDGTLSQQFGHTQTPDHEHDREQGQ